MIEHFFAFPNQPLPPVDEHKLLDYVVAANATFVRSRRPGLEVCLPVSVNFEAVRGLAPLAPYAQWGFPRIPLKLVETMLAVSKGVCTVSPREALFYLHFNEVTDCKSLLPHVACESGWHVLMPGQRASVDSVVPLDPISNIVADAVVELHSHHAMRAEFSSDDDADESQGFRVYAVIGTIFDNPIIHARVGLFGHFYDYPASEFFELPEELADAVKE